MEVAAVGSYSGWVGIGARSSAERDLASWDGEGREVRGGDAVGSAVSCVFMSSGRLIGGVRSGRTAVD